MNKVALVYGPPGSGKGTQADLLQAVQEFFHFDTGRYIEQVIRDPANAKNKIVQREKKLFDAGILCTPSWVLGIVSKKARVLAKAGISLVFSGSPRTIFEAFGDSKNQGLMDALEKAYGKKNIRVFSLKVSPKISIWRNSHRLVCSTCGAPILYQKGLPSRKAAARRSRKMQCAFCSAPLRTRSLDDPKIIKVRLKQYEERTRPILEGLKKRGYKVYAINGEPAPYLVFRKILNQLKI